MNMYIRFFVFLTFIFISSYSFSMNRKAYAEDYYKLFHKNLYMQKEDISANITYLTNALNTDFIYPLYALAKIQDEKQWEKYKFLFKAHVNLKIIEMYLMLAKIYHKLDYRFYDQPFAQTNLKGIETAKEIYKKIPAYWEEAKKWAQKAGDKDMYFIEIPELNNWNDEVFRINDGSLDYERITNRHVKDLEEIENYFKNNSKKP